MALVQEIQVPLLAVNDTTLTVVELTVTAGSAVKKGDLILVLETSKTTYDVEAQADGFIQYLCEADRDYAVNEVVARIFSGQAEALEAPPRPAGRPVPAAVANPNLIANPAAGPMTSPVASLPADPGLNGHYAQPDPPANWVGDTVFSHEAERLIGSAGLDKSLFRNRDFVSAADVQHMLQPPARATGTGQPGAGRTSSTGAAGAFPPVDPAKAVLQRLSSAKRREIEYLADVQSTGLTSTVNTVIEVEGIFTHLNPAMRYLKDSLLPVIVYEAARLLAGYPLLNAWFNGDGIAVYRDVQPGFAIDIDKGLKVVKLAGAGKKTVAAIENDILELSGRYLDDTLTIEDLSDISFTITDLSAEGVAFFRPLVNRMNSAILGVSAIDPRLQRCTLGLSFDHRVTEGKLAARFLRELKERIESYRPSGYAPHRDISCFKCHKTLAEDLGGAGFVRCVTPGGHDGYICQACIKGF